MGGRLEIIHHNGALTFKLHFAHAELAESAS